MFEKDAVKGCIFGGAIGDALGYPVEFTGEGSIFGKYGPEGIQTLKQAAQADGGDKAVISDDTQMTMFAACAITFAYDHPETGLKKALKEAYLEWLSTQKGVKIFKEENPLMWIYSDRRLHMLRAPGNTCMRAINAYVYEPDLERADNNSKGCGTVMRAAPFGLMRTSGNETEDEKAVIDAAVYDAQLTHGHPKAAASSAVLAQAVYRILRKREAYKRLEDVFAESPAGTENMNKLVDKAIALALDESIADLDGIHALGEGWVGDEALAIAVFCAVRYQDDFAKAIRVSVNHKGDSDSTGAVCGNLLGAWLGFEAVSKAFDLNDLELTDVLDKIAETI